MSSQIKTNGLFCDTECPFFRDDHEGTASCFSDGKWKALVYSWSAKETPRHKSCVLGELAEKDKEIERLGKQVNEYMDALAKARQETADAQQSRDCESASHYDFVEKTAAMIGYKDFWDNGDMDNAVIKVLDLKINEIQDWRDMCDKLAFKLQSIYDIRPVSKTEITLMLQGVHDLLSAYNAMKSGQPASEPMKEAGK
jgi:hypothetical protein